MTEQDWTKTDEEDYKCLAVTIARNVMTGRRSSDWALEEFRGLNARREAADHESRRRTRARLEAPRG